MREYLDRHGAEVAAFATFDKRDDREAARISADSIAAAIAALARGARLDRVFVSCTSLRLAEADASDRGGAAFRSPPAITRWPGIACGLPGVNDTVPHAGRLFACGIG